MHPKQEDILKYIWEELEEDRAIEISEHMADCPECASQAQKEARFQFLWENWDAGTHGQLHWRESIQQILRKSYQSSSSFLVKQKLKGWLDHWKGCLGSLVQFLSKAGEEVMEVATRFPGEIFARDAQYEFATAAPVRGSLAAERVIRMQTRENPEIQLYFDEEKRNLLIKIPNAELDPPLIILVPRIGVPQTIYPENVPGTNYYSASFTRIPPGGFMLLFEPLPNG